MASGKKDLVKSEQRLKKY